MLFNDAQKTTKGKAKILIVDDKPDNLSALEEILNDLNCNIIKANSGKEALEKLIEHNIALILLDVQMPGMDGFETAKLIHGIEDTRNIPIIFLTAVNKEKRNIYEGYQSGAVDYLFKPIEPHVLQKKVDVFIKLYYQMHGFEKLSKIDSLTGLSNRRHIIDKMENEIELCKINENKFSIIMGDIDNFKEINDTFGHGCGDSVLVKISNTLKGSIRDKDIACRWGGEEFLVLLPETDLKTGIKIAERIKNDIESMRVRWDDFLIKVTISLGVSQYEPQLTIPECIKKADQALYTAKIDGKNRVRFDKTCS